MNFDEFVENVVWSATFPLKRHYEACNRAHQAARRKLSFRYGIEFRQLEAMAPMRVIAREIAQARGRRLESWLADMVRRPPAWGVTASETNRAQANKFQA